MSGSFRRLQWYARRLRSMAPAEVALHVRRAATYRYDAVAWHLAPAIWRRVWQPEYERILDVGAAPAEPLLLSRARVQSVERELASGWDEIVAEAKRRLDMIRGSEPGFDRDPVSGTPWPDRHGRLIDYRLATPGDPQRVWEIERCQELPLLALASLLTEDARFADSTAVRLRKWLGAHRPGRGIAWANAFEPGLRSVSLAIAFDALRGHPLLGDEREVARGMWQHGRWIVSDRSRFSSANNHLVAELTGLLAIAVLVPELHDSGAWRRLALAELSREAELQILPDGVAAEQSFAYGLFTTDLFLTCAALLEAVKIPCPGPIAAALGRFADALALIVDVGEPEPAFGDDDDARAVVLDGAGERTVCGVAASLAAFLGHPGSRRLAGSLDPAAAVLFGPQGVARFEAAGSGAAPGSGALPDGGIVVFREGGARAMFDAGPLGYLSIAAHGHADTLQVLLSHGGDELVTDPGTGAYLADPSLRRRLRGTAAHATVTVDGLDQSEQGGPFLWTKHARGRLLACDLAGGVVVGEHDGYLRLPDPVAHRRAIVALGDGAILVVDSLTASGEHEFVQAWPLHPALDPLERDGFVVASSGGCPKLVLALAASRASAIYSRRDGVWSRRLDETEPTWVVSQRLGASGPIELAALLVPVGEGRPLPAVRLALVPDGAVSTVELGVDEMRRNVRLVLTDDPPCVETRP